MLAEAYGGEVQGGSLLRITNQGGLLQCLGVGPVGLLVALRWPRVAVAKKGYLAHAPRRSGQATSLLRPLHVGPPHNGLSLFILGRPELDVSQLLPAVANVRVAAVLMAPNVLTE